jgi:hypothetical protein
MAARPFDSRWRRVTRVHRCPTSVRPIWCDASAGSALDRDALLAMGHSEEHADWLLARAPREGCLLCEEYEALLPDLPGWLGRREEVQR